MKLLNSQAGTLPQAGLGDVVVEFLLRHNIPLTRTNYLTYAYPDGIPSWMSETDIADQIPDEIVG